MGEPASPAGLTLAADAFLSNGTMYQASEITWRFVENPYGHPLEDWTLTKPTATLACAVGGVYAVTLWAKFDYGVSINIIPYVQVNGTVIRGTSSNNYFNDPNARQPVSLSTTVVLKANDEVRFGIITQATSSTLGIDPNNKMFAQILKVA
jgi:hypothetical protein